MGEMRRPQAGGPRGPHVYLSSSSRSLWFSLAAMALVLCSCCRASLSALKTFSSSSSSALCFSMSLCLQEGTPCWQPVPQPFGPSGNTHPGRPEPPPWGARLRWQGIRRVVAERSPSQQPGRQCRVGQFGGLFQPQRQEVPSSHLTSLHSPLNPLSRHPSSLGSPGTPELCPLNPTPFS